MRLQHEASIWPHVYHGMSYRDSGHFLYTVRNVGLGPAKIVDAQILYEDNLYTDYYAFLKDFLKVPEDSVRQKIAFGYTTLKGRVLAPGEQIDAMSISTPDVSSQLFSKQDKWTVKICYSSISNKYWDSKSFGDAEEVKSCD